MTTHKKTIRVVGAAIIRDGQVLCLQRSATMSLPHLWEFPGGKIEAGETGPQALAREIQEELQLTITVGEAVTTARHDYDFATVELTVYLARIDAGQLTLLEHEAARWVAPADLLTLDWAPVDIPAATLLTHRPLDTY